MDAVYDKPGQDKDAEDASKRPSRREAEEAVRTLIAWAGDDPDREGLQETPARVVNAYEDFYGGYRADIDALLDRTFAEYGAYDDLVLIRDISFFSHCEHHMVPFVGKAHVAYYPVGRIVGLSKIARVVDAMAQRLQTQERLTAQVAAALDSALEPRGVAVFIEAEHQCMTLRGVRKHGTSTVTTKFTGVFHDDPAERHRFLSMIGGNR